MPRGLPLDLPLEEVLPGALGNQDCGALSASAPIEVTRESACAPLLAHRCPHGAPLHPGQPPLR